MLTNQINPRGLKMKVLEVVQVYCEIISFYWHKISLFENDGQVSGHLNSWISNYTHIFFSEQIFCWDFKFVDCPTHKKTQIECQTTNNDFTVFIKTTAQYLISYFLTTTVRATY